MKINNISIYFQQVKSGEKDLGDLFIELEACILVGDIENPLGKLILYFSLTLKLSLILLIDL